MTPSRGLGRGLGSLIPRATPPAAEPPTVSAAPAAQVPGAPLIVPIERIVPNPHQPRQHFAHGDLDDLIASIKKHGVLQPLVVTTKGDGTYELIAGERRLRASSMAGLTEVPIVVRAAAAQEKLELALIENIQRADLNPIEEAKAYQILMRDYDLTQEAVADQLGKSRAVIANTLRLLDLPQEIQDAVQSGKVPSTAARALLSLRDPDAQLAWWKKLAKEGLSVHALEEGVRTASRGAGRDPNVAAAEDALRQILGAKVHISKRGPAGRIQISFFSDDEFSELIERLSQSA